MLNNLRAEMARFDVTPADIAREIGKSDRCVRDKISGKTDVSIPEAMEIRDKFFPGLSLEYLFAKAGQGGATPPGPV